jgi:hypothetical protein
MLARRGFRDVRPVLEGGMPAYWASEPANSEAAEDENGGSDPRPPVGHERAGTRPRP